MGSPVGIGFSSFVSDHVGADIAFNRRRMEIFSANAQARIQIQLRYATLNLVLDSNAGHDYSYTPTLYMPPIAGVPKHITAGTGETIRIFTTPSYPHSVIKDGSTTVAETFNGQNLEFTLGNGYHDLDYYFCADSGYSNCTSTPTTVDVGGGLSMILVNEVTPPFFTGNCFLFNGISQLSDGPDKACIAATSPDFYKVPTATILSQNQDALALGLGANGFGAVYDRIKNVNPALRAYCEANPQNISDCSFAFLSAGIGLQAGAYCDDGDTTTGAADSTAGNAIQHILWAYALAEKVGRVRAKALLDRYEGSATACDNPTPGSATAMDCTNNAYGLDLSDNQIILYRNLAYVYWKAVQNMNLQLPGIQVNSGPSTCAGSPVKLPWWN